MIYPREDIPDYRKDCLSVYGLEMAEKIAESGDAKAQTELGMRYLFGANVEEDRVRSYYWFSKAASQGVRMAQYMTGLDLLYGEGVKRS